MAFTGRAIYSNYATIPEDVSDLVTIISPREVPLLDYIGDAPYAAINPYHQ